MPGQDCAAIQRAEHAQVDHFAAVAQAHRGHRANQRIAVAGDVACSTVEDGTDGV